MFLIEEELKSSYSELDIINVVNIIDNMSSTFIIKDKIELNKSDVLLLLQKIYTLRNSILINKESTQQYMHVLHILAVSLLYYNEHKLKYDDEFFRRQIYYPIMLYCIINGFKSVSKLLFTLVKRCFNDISDDVMKMYLLFYKNSDYLKNDIIEYFINYIVNDLDPLSLQNFADYYYGAIKKLSYFYIKNRLDGLISYNFNPLFLQENIDMILSDRYHIYENGFHLYYMQNICKKSTSITRIMNNFNQLKSNILTNELQSLLSLYTNNMIENANSKTMLLYMYDLNNTILDDIKEKFPIIYKLLRSIKYKSNDVVINPSDKHLLKLNIYKTLMEKFKSIILDGKLVTTLADNISNNLVDSLSYGKYIDPLTMDNVNINSKLFINQFNKFLDYLVNFENDRRI